MKNIFILLICIFNFSVLFSQKDTVLLQNGRELIGHFIQDEVYDIEFKHFTKKGYETIKIDKYRIFSLIDSTGKEKLYYKYDTTIGNYLPEKRMRMYVYGERDAVYGFKTPFTNTTGLALGGASGYLMIKDKNFVFIATPLLYTVGNLFFSTRVRKNSVRHLQYIKDDDYLSGYDRVARGKRVNNALKYSLGGMVLGIVAGLVTN
tara:strand:- start:71135 stop:71749 length:615 start_codon:yes stop_codon:yes gene_type:complete